MSVLHRAEARKRVEELLRSLAARPEIERSAVVEDVLGTFGLVIWTTSPPTPEFEASLSGAIDPLAPYLTMADLVLVPPGGDGDSTVRDLHEATWQDGRSFGEGDELRWVDRYRGLGSWFGDPETPPWPADGPSQSGPPVVVFYSFKGGVGRTTGLAAFALQRAAMGERVAAIDLDLDAPGLGALLAPSDTDQRASYGVVDYLLERPLLETIDVRDYAHPCRPKALEGRGELWVLPAGRVDPSYTAKLARLDLEPQEPGTRAPLRRLLDEVREQLRPEWILLDSRAGLSNPAGALLSGIAHLHVLFSTSSEQSFQGLRVVISRLAAQWTEAGRRQADCVLIHSKVPESGAPHARKAFAKRAWELFEELYYAAVPETPEADDDGPYDLRDAESSDAPHVPCPVHYSGRLAAFEDLEEVSDILLSWTDLVAMARRISERFQSEDLERTEDGSQA